MGNWQSNVLQCANSPLMFAQTNQEGVSAKVPRIQSPPPCKQYGHCGMPVNEQFIHVGQQPESTTDTRNSLNNGLPHHHDHLYPNLNQHQYPHLSCPGTPSLPLLRTPSPSLPRQPSVAHCPGTPVLHSSRTPSPQPRRLLGETLSSPRHCPLSAQKSNPPYERPAYVSCPNTPLTHSDNNLNSD